MARPRSAHRWTVEVFRLDRQRERVRVDCEHTICSDYPIMGNLHDFRRGARAYDSCVLRDFEWKLCTFASTFLQRASRVVLSVIHTLQLVVRPSPSRCTSHKSRLCRRPRSLPRLAVTRRSCSPRLIQARATLAYVEQARRARLARVRGARPSKNPQDSGRDLRTRRA